MKKRAKYNPTEDPVLRDFVALLKEKLGKHLKGVILFGSRARGDAEPDSDYDILVLLDRKPESYEDTIDVAAYRMMEDYEALVCAFGYTHTEFEKRRFTPLFVNARREGVHLYG